MQIQVLSIFQLYNQKPETRLRELPVQKTPRQEAHGRQTLWSKVVSLA